ncbi:MAG: sulfatase-like hydrolase/transferase [Gammaproteobacteria bacterium]|nr:sulfatase-like hydrolase/transferase [Gammaproteobacteria bacterium]MDE0274110.1 sulfatase-like hydrolase/transferase [Gammaproteobacteria bacterium]
MGRKGIGVLLGLALLIGVAWAYRAEIAIWGIGALVEWRRDIGPNREVAWQRGPEQPAQPPSERPPNIVLILADDMGWNDVSTNGGGAGGGSVKTPHIDAIAQGGVNFTAGYSANGTCAPSRAAVLSGRYGTRFGFEFTPTPSQMAPLLRLARAGDDTPRRDSIPNPDFELVEWEDMGMPAGEVTLAETLKTAGYHTVHIGKWHVGESNGMAAYDQGFDESLLMEGVLFLPEDHPDAVNAKQGFDPIDRFLWTMGGYGVRYNGGEAFAPQGHVTDYYTDQAVQVIEANRNRPFFLYLAHWAIHTPLQSTRADYDAYPHIESHTERTYAGMIRGLDRSVGRVLDALREHGLEDNTLVIFTSDNGGAGYLGLPDVNRPFRGWKITFFEGGIHVPFMMRWPAQITPERTFAEPVHHFDIYATAAAAAGAPMPNDRVMDGVDLLPYVRGEAEDVPHETLFWTQDHYRVVLHQGWKLQRSGPNDEFIWLFDLNADPTERNNLAHTRPDKVEELDALLAAHLAEQAPPRWPHRASNPVSIDKHLNQPESPDDEYIYYPN